MMHLLEQILGANIVAAIWLAVAAVPVVCLMYLAIRTVRQRGLCEALKPIRKGWRVLAVLAAIALAFVLLVYVASFAPQKGRTPSALTYLLGVGLPLAITLFFIRKSIQDAARHLFSRPAQEPTVAINKDSEFTPGWSLRKSEPRAHEFPALKAKPTLTNEDEFGRM
jgi:hypothetical protein